MGIKPVLSNTDQIEKFIGKGGTGTVYRARHLRLDQFCAVKEIDLANSEIWTIGFMFLCSENSVIRRSDTVKNGLTILHTFFLRGGYQ